MYHYKLNAFERHYQMMHCWNPNPLNRPTFSQLKTDLEGLLDSYSEEKYESLMYVRPKLLYFFILLGNWITKILSLCSSSSICMTFYTAYHMYISMCTACPLFFISLWLQLRFYCVQLLFMYTMKLLSVQVLCSS